MKRPSHPQLIRKLKRVLKGWRDAAASPAFQMAKPVKPSVMLNHCAALLARALGPDGVRKPRFSQLTRGVRVRHTLFGDGRVVAQTYEDITITFDDHGTKTLMLDFSRGKLSVILARTRKSRAA